MDRCEKCGLKIDVSTHSYSDLGGYECYKSVTRCVHCFKPTGSDATVCNECLILYHSVIS